jgi:hypothetical protein
MRVQVAGTDSRVLWIQRIPAQQKASRDYSGWVCAMTPTAGVLRWVFLVDGPLLPPASHLPSRRSLLKHHVESHLRGSDECCGALTLITMPTPSDASPPAPVGMASDTRGDNRPLTAPWMADLVSGSREQSSNPQRFFGAMHPSKSGLVHIHTVKRIVARAKRLEITKDSEARPGRCASKW